MLIKLKGMHIKYVHPFFDGHNYEYSVTANERGYVLLY